MKIAGVAVALAVVALAGCGGERPSSTAQADRGDAPATTAAVPELMKAYDDTSLRALAAEAEAVAVVQATRSRPRPTDSTRVYQIATVKVSDVIAGPLAVGDVIDVRQNAAAAGVAIEHDLLEPGQTYVLFLWDARWPNDEDRPLFHTFGVFESSDEGMWVDASLQKTLPAAEQVVTLERIRASLR